MIAHDEEAVETVRWAVEWTINRMYVRYIYIYYILSIYLIHAYMHSLYHVTTIIVVIHSYISILSFTHNRTTLSFRMPLIIYLVQVLL